MAQNGVMQNIPGLAIIAISIAGVGALPYGVHKLYYGESRKVGLDRWDYEMNKRDRRLEELKKFKEKTDLAQAQARANELAELELEAAAE